MPTRPGVLTSPPGSFLLCVALLLCSCGADAGSPPGNSQPGAAQLQSPAPIVLITVDTLRRDHLGCYGYFRDTTPHLDALAAEGVLFEHAVATMATTLPSHLSLLTGLYPHQHGMQTNRSGAVRPFEPSAGRTSVAVLLRGAGYQTAAFTSAAPVCHQTGVLAGFDFVDDVSNGARPALEAARNAVRWINAAGSEPFFAWIHLWDPHEPNLPAAKHMRALAADGDEAARLDELLRTRGVSASGLQAHGSPHAMGRVLFPELAQEEQRPAVNSEALRSMLTRYDGDVRATDEAIGRVIAKLKATELWDRAIVIVAADHGQSLGQHDWFDHGTITNENILVPLLAHFPTGLVEQPQRVRGTVSLVDVMPTVLARLALPGATGLEEFAEQAEGRDIFSGSFERPHAFVQRSTMQRKGWVEGRKFALVGKRWKYVHYEQAPDELYDLEADPLETRDVLAEQAGLARQFESEVRALIARNPAPANRAGQAPEGELLEALEALGYIEGE